MSEQVFRSYSRSDQAAAGALRLMLEQAGLTVFKDDRSIRCGDRWLDRLQKALAGCSAFVVLVGQDGVRGWVSGEVSAALTRHHSPRDDADRLPIFPVLLGDSPVDTLGALLADFQACRWSLGEPVSRELIAAISDRRVGWAPRGAFEGCPFVGLKAFGRDDAQLFFGRRRETLAALACLGDTQQRDPQALRSGGGPAYCRWLQVAGNSGAGKSSLVNAGMLPMIEAGALWARTGFDRWRILGPMRPGRTPLANLATAVENGLIDDPARRDILVRLQRYQKNKEVLSPELRGFGGDQTAFVLVVDQFEELFTFADPASRNALDALLATALEDPECPLFLITTVRADFLDRFEQLPNLNALYNSHCKHWFLPTISGEGLREVIEQPARLAGLDVSEVTEAIIEDARDEIGALPLVENALLLLWEQRRDGKLSGEVYHRTGKIAGMLATQADDLLAGVDREVAGGGKAALELLLRLTRIGDDGRHTRQRISRDEAVAVAGNGRDALGERVVRMLSGERPADQPGRAPAGVLRLVTTSSEESPAGGERRSVDLIHETLIRARSRDPVTGRPVGYWPALYEYIEANRDRDLLRQQLRLQVERWDAAGALARWSRLAGWGDLWRYRRLRLGRCGREARFILWSRRAAAAQGALLLALVSVFAVFAEAAWWANENGLPVSYILHKPLWLLGFGPLPNMVDIEPGSFTMGCELGRDVVERKCHPDELAHRVTLTRRFSLGRHEVSFIEYDYSVWERKRQGIATLDNGAKLDYPPAHPFERGDRPVITVNWHEARAYAEWLNDKTDGKRPDGERYRLPSEAEWEYAARDGTETAYWWGQNFDATKANCDGTVGRTTARGAYPTSARWKLNDMAGNVWEWVEDYFKAYTAGEVTDPAGPEAGDAKGWREMPNEGYWGEDLTYLAKLRSGKFRATRGGSWVSIPSECRAVMRMPASPDSHSPGIGFRVCLGSPIGPPGAAPLTTVPPGRWTLGAAQRRPNPCAGPGPPGVAGSPVARYTSRNSRLTSRTRGGDPRLGGDGFPILAGRELSGDAGDQEDQSASGTRISMCRPAAVAIFTSASRRNKLILPRIKSETRGCVTAKSLAAFARLISLRAI